jgi:hypothetical protein
MLPREWRNPFSDPVVQINFEASAAARTGRKIDDPGLHVIKGNKAGYIHGDHSDRVQPNRRPRPLQRLSFARSRVLLLATI